MKTYVSYVIQDGNGHKHQSEIVTTKSPSHSYSPDPLVEDIIKWADNKKKNLNPHEELVITGMYKI